MFSSLELSSYAEISALLSCIDINSDYMISGIDRITKSNSKKIIKIIENMAISSNFFKSHIYYSYRDRLILDPIEGVSFKEYMQVGQIIDSIIMLITGKTKNIFYIEIKTNSIIQMIKNLLGCNAKKAKSVVSMFIFSAKSEKWIEPWDRPFYMMGENILSSPTIVSTRNYVRSFENWCMKLNPSLFSEMGNDVEDAVFKIIDGKADLCLIRRTISLNGEDIEFDIIAAIDETLLIFEVKFTKSVYSKFDLANFRSKMSHAAQQLNYREQIIELNKSEFSRQIGRSFENIIKIAVVNGITVGGYFDRDNNIYFTDINTLRNYFQSPLVQIFEMSKDILAPVVKDSFMFRDEQINAEDLKTFLSKPYNIMMYYNYIDSKFDYVNHKDKSIGVEAFYYQWGDLMNRFNILKAEYEIRKHE